MNPRPYRFTQTIQINDVPGEISTITIDIGLSENTITAREVKARLLKEREKQDHALIEEHKKKPKEFYPSMIVVPFAAKLTIDQIELENDAIFIINEDGSKIVRQKDGTQTPVPNIIGISRKAIIIPFDLTTVMLSGNNSVMPQITVKVHNNSTLGGIKKAILSELVKQNPSECADLKMADICLIDHKQQTIEDSDETLAVNKPDVFNHGNYLALKYHLPTTIAENITSAIAQKRSLSIINELSRTVYITSLSSRNKHEFLNKLENKLEDMNRDQILDLFAEMKKPNGKFAFIHEQRNPLWDSFRLFFCAERNGEKNFWHTKTYQTAVKMLKDAYVKKVGDYSDDGRLVAAGELVDYVRGNAPRHTSMTSTRKNHY